MTSALFRIATLLGIVLFAAGVGSEAHAQMRAPDERRWLNCSVSLTSSTYDTGPNFTVKVSFHDDPVSSVRVLLAREDARPDERDWTIVATSETDSRGIGRFFAIPLGKYRIRVDGGLLAPGSEEIEVNANGDATAKINFEWPGSSLAARNLRGKLTASNKSKKAPVPLQNVLVQLLDLRTARLFASTHTNSGGYYEFPSHNPGLYVVRINEDQDDLSPHTDDMAVEVKTNAFEENIPVMQLTVTDCGTKLSGPPDEALFERAMSAVEQKRFSVANLSLQTLVNTYPNSEYASKAKLVLEDPQIAECSESFSSTPYDCDEKPAATSPTD